MKSTICSLALIGLAFAGPVQRRDRATSVVVTTEWTTTTVYVNPPSGAAFAENQHNKDASSSSSAVPSSIVIPSAVPSPSAPAPVVPSHVPTPEPVANPAPTAAAAAAGIIKSATGQGTYYDVSVGLGSCGLPANNNQKVVALSMDMMANGANSNTNDLCGREIIITGEGGVKHSGIVHDSCQGCAYGDVDLSTEWFKIVFPKGDGRVNGVSWVITDAPKAPGYGKA